MGVRGYILEAENGTVLSLSLSVQVHIGVRGYVLEAENGTVLSDVRIAVAGINHNVSTGRFGDYYRLLLPGSYNITASHPG